MNDWTNNVIGSKNEIILVYPATAQGQKRLFFRIKSMIKNNPYGIGFCDWGGEWVSFNGSTSNNGSSWENQAFWDFTGKSLPVLELY